MSSKIFLALAAADSSELGALATMWAERLILIISVTAVLYMSLRLLADTVARHRRPAALRAYQNELARKRKDYKRYLNKLKQRRLHADSADVEALLEQLRCQAIQEHHHNMLDRLDSAMRLVEQFDRHVRRLNINRTNASTAQLKRAVQIVNRELLDDA